MALILNIESATEICSVCLADGLTVLSSERLTEKYKHSEKMTLLIESCMKKAGKKLQNIDAVALSSGPGSYTSLRVGASVAKGICYGLDKPLISVETMQALAWGAKLAFREANPVFIRPMLDARRMEVYTKLFTSDIKAVDELKPEVVTETSFIKELDAGLTLFAGNGSEKIQSVFNHPNARFLSLDCSSEYMIPFGDRLFSEEKFENIASFEPVYLKPPNITTPKKAFGI